MFFPVIADIHFLVQSKVELFIYTSASSKPIDLSALNFWG